MTLTAAAGIDALRIVPCVEKSILKPRRVLVN